MKTLKQLLAILVTLILGGGAFPVATEPSEGDS